jgi:hypothetical protein
VHPFSKHCSWFWAANLAGPEPKLSILSEGQDRAALQHAVLLVPSRKPGRTCTKIVHFNPGGQGCAALQHAVLRVPGRKSGWTCAKIVYFKRRSRLCSPSARGAPGSRPQTAWAGPVQTSSILTEGQGSAALQHAVLLVPSRKPGRTCAKIVHFNQGSRPYSSSASSAPSSRPQTWLDLSRNCFFF